MDRDDFWTVIATAGEAGPTTEARISALTAVLESAPVDDVASFDVHLSELVSAAMRWDLWGASYLMCGGCSDDAFWDFRVWLVLQGRAIYEAALADPDSLASVEIAEGDYPSAEELLYLAGSVYEAMTGEPLDRPSVTASELGELDWDFDDDDEAQRRYPRLFDRYAEDPL